MKRIVGIELSHQKAPLAIREKISLSKDELLASLKTLREDVDEVFIIATCNRLAVYALASELSPLQSFFARFGDLTDYLAVYEHTEITVRHLFATASGLESQALGEHEILGQIRTAFTLAQEAESIGPVFHELIREAISTGKRVRKETAIGKHPVSLASVSYDILKRVHKDLSKTNILVLGTGEMAALVLKVITKRDVNELYIASKSFDRALTLAALSDAAPVNMANLKEMLPKVDVIIGATLAHEPLLRAADLEAIQDEKSLTFIDLGMPRNFGVDIKNLPDHRLYDLDDIKAQTYQSLQKRQEEVPKAIAMVEEQMAEFISWLQTREISPVISSYFAKVDKIREEELQWALPKLGQLDEQQKKIVENLVSRMARRLSGKPIEKLRDFALQPETTQRPVDTFKELFDL